MAPLALGAISVLAVLVWTQTACSEDEPQAARLPNILLILADDK